MAKKAKARAKPKSEAVFLLRLRKTSKALGGNKNKTFDSRGAAEAQLRRLGGKKAGRVQLWNRPA